MCPRFESGPPRRGHPIYADLAAEWAAPDDIASQVGLLRARTHVLAARGELPAEHTPLCPLGRRLGRAGLLWIGEAFYPTPRAFMEEAARMGISRRITAVPRDFQSGRTWVLCAHRSAIAPTEPGGDPIAAVFTLFRPTAVEYVVRGDETEQELERLVERGIQPMRVERAEPPLEGMDPAA